MPHSQYIIRNHPQTLGLNTQLLERCIASCLDCAESCRSAADVALANGDIAVRRYLLRTLLDCADVCHATARTLLRQTDPNALLMRYQLNACVSVIHICEQECVKRAGTPGTYRLCADACSQSKNLCAELLKHIT